MRPTYKYQEVGSENVLDECPLCCQKGELNLRHMDVEVKANFLIPMGTYREVWARCSRCRKEYPISEDYARVLEPSSKAKRLHLAAWLTLPIPFVSLALMILTLRETPKTANETRMWTLIGLVPAGLIALMFLGLLLSISI
ncbi:MAG: hypothetical protein R6U51_08280 [Anaerolineales bacterium]